MVDQMLGTLCVAIVDECRDTEMVLTVRGSPRLCAMSWMHRLRSALQKKGNNVVVRGVKVNVRRARTTSA